MLSYDSLRKYNINIKFVFITIDPERGTLSIHFQAFSTYENVSNELHKKYFFFQNFVLCPFSPTRGRANFCRFSSSVLLEEEIRAFD